MRRQAYDSPSVPITWSRLEYCAGTNEYVQVDASLKAEVEKLYRENPEEAKQNFGEKPFELKNILKYWVRSKKRSSYKERKGNALALGAEEGRG